MAVDPEEGVAAPEKMEEDIVPSVKSKSASKELPKDDQLSPEDQAQKEGLELMVERIQDHEAGVQKMALESMRKEIRMATSSMTSVPKPLKFLRPHYSTLKAAYESVADGNKTLLADVISVLAMTMSQDGARESLAFRLLGTEGDLGSWGHEYVRNLAGEIGQEYQLRMAAESSVEDLMKLVDQIVPFHIQHNAEPEAVDLLMEVDGLEKLVDVVSVAHYKRTCLYLTSCASYVSESDDVVVLRVSYDLYRKFDKLPDALRMALRMNNRQYVLSTFLASKGAETRQLAYMMARQGFVTEPLESVYEGEEEERERLSEILNNGHVTGGYMALGRDLDVMEPKTAEDIYKSHLLDGRASSSATVDSARQNLATTFVNGFVNAGFGRDKLLYTGEAEPSGNWLFKNKDHGKISATASLGLIFLWDVDGGLPVIDKYLYSTDPCIVAGANLAVGVLNCGVRNDNDPAMALLCEAVEKEDPGVRIGAIMGLGLAYVGAEKEELLSLLVPLIIDLSVPLDVCAFSCVSLGLIFVGTANEEAAAAILGAMEEREGQMGEPCARFLAMGLGLLFMGKQSAAHATLSVVDTLGEKMKSYTQITLDSLAYAGTGNVLKIQSLLSLCGEHLPEGSITTHQSAAVLGLALIAGGEEVGTEMCLRALQHLLQYGDPPVRRAVPLAMGLLAVSNPKIGVMDALSRLSHDADAEVAMGAVLCLGLIGAGTNNARIASLLRSLSSYYAKDASALFAVRIAQGLTHMGKGLLTLNPFHSDKLLCSNVALAGLSTFLHSCLDIKGVILGRHHYALYYLVPAIQPRLLLTVDENLQPLPVSVRVGTAVDIVGQAGRPNTITGGQTHTTPVLLATGERAELATNKYIPLTSVLEGYVILKKNPNYVEDHLG